MNTPLCQKCQKAPGFLCADDTRLCGKCLRDRLPRNVAVRSGWSVADRLRAAKGRREGLPR